MAKFAPRSIQAVATELGLADEESSCMAAEKRRSSSTPSTDPRARGARVG